MLQWYVKTIYNLLLMQLRTLNIDHNNLILQSVTIYIFYGYFHYFYTFVLAFHFSIKVLRLLMKFILFNPMQLNYRTFLKMFHLCFIFSNSAFMWTLLCSSCPFITNFRKLFTIKQIFFPDRISEYCELYHSVNSFSIFLKL